MPVDAATDYSQWGEQPLIAATLAKLPARDRWCVDVGAGDGVTGSNTRALVESGYWALLFEGNSEKIDDLHRNARNTKTFILERVVSSLGENSLDTLIASVANTPPDFDFLSIDIDGNDYHVWKSLTNYRPKLVMIEFNPTVADGLGLIQPDSPTLMVGSSLDAIVALGNEKGYELCGVTVTNALFVRRDLFHHLGITDNSIKALWTNRSFMTWLFYGYDGETYVAGYGRCPWGASSEQPQAAVVDG